MADVRIAVIGGTGVEEGLGIESGEQVRPETPFGLPSSPITLTQWQGVDVAVLRRHGEGHVFNPTQVPYRANIFALKTLGVTHIVATGAVGSLREEIEPGHLVIADQVIDKTWARPQTFFESAAVHLELAEPFCPVTRRWLLEAVSRFDRTPVHDRGTYVCMEGPCFSTRAESHMHRAWGGDLIGMTVMPEAKLAREAEIAYALVALPTDYDCWRAHDAAASEQELLAEIIGNLKRASEAGIALVREALTDCDMLRNEPSPAHAALRLGIWSDKSKIDPQEVSRLRPIWGAYFDNA
jgi:5'-methylthioadenosine phosphorylase